MLERSIGGDIGIVDPIIEEYDLLNRCEVVQKSTDMNQDPVIDRLVREPSRGPYRSRL